MGLQKGRFFAQGLAELKNCSKKAVEGGCCGVKENMALVAGPVELFMRLIDADFLTAK
jgi:hypothetical protein